MNEDIKRMLIDAFGRIIYLSVIFFFFIYILYLHNEVVEPLKESFSASLSLFSVLATLAAAFIASSLFNDWKAQHDKNIESDSALEIMKIVIKCKTEMRKIYSNIKLKDNRQISNVILNNEIKDSTKKIVILVESCLEKLELFNELTINDNFKKDISLKSMEGFLLSFQHINLFGNSTNYKFIENSEKFLIVIQNFMGTCDEFNTSLKPYIKANSDIFPK
ncbi:hypothetical protein KTH44_09595 [Acinetobacter bereziniae]|uniref:hypothetical protein n=1 Tax=Acinetobacter bereziniae TaxID=106648 RepID=UPI0021CDE7DC|nr:hypothetical protein [Acinetobacter bereziniae]MCU4319381.1 hypothetical protein [Acinetobacter bereziniae]